MNSFGFGGTNSHAVLDDAYHYLQQRGLTGRHCTKISPTLASEILSIASNCTSLDDHTQGMQLPTSRLFVWSATDEKSIQRLLSSYHSHLRVMRIPEGMVEKYLKALALTLFERRSLLSCRTFAVASSLAELINTTKTSPTSIRSQQDSKLGFVFTGQGVQWNGMGRELLAYPIFRQSLKRADAYLQSLGCLDKLAGKSFSSR